VPSSERALVAVALAGVLAGCDPSASDPADAGPDDPDPAFTADERAALATLRYDDAPAPPDPSNRLSDDPDARRFGQRLFFETSLSGRLIEGDNDGSAATLGQMGEPGRVSCAGCHLPADSFVDTRSPHRQISLAALWTRRRAPTLLEIGFAPLLNWDGARDSIWGQAIGVMENQAEFNSGRLFVAQQLFRLHRAEYEALFGPMPALDGAPYPQLAPDEAGCIERVTTEGLAYECRGKPGDGADFDALAAADPEAARLVTEVTVNAAKALDAYVRQLRCGAGRFDAWLDGDSAALSRAEQRGAALFVGPAGCIACHSGPNLTDGRFHNVGMAPAPVAVTFIDVDDRGAAEGIPLAIADPLNSRGPFSDGDRGTLPASLDPALEGAFRTPTLRCIAAQPSFMHTGQLTSLRQVIRFFDRGGDHGGYPGESEIAELGLSDRERDDLEAFVRALVGPGPAPALLSPLPES
jgi:cytochrome c peroxidase